MASLTKDDGGNFYGTASAGGKVARPAFPRGQGVVYRISASGTQSVLYRFQALRGASPLGDLAFDGKGHLYGTTYWGGAGNSGVVFRLGLNGAEHVLYAFTGGNDGARPVAGVVLERDGSVVGPSFAGGAQNDGTLFRVSTTGTETVIHAFTDTPDGALPNSTPTQDRDGSLYGTTVIGGAHNNGTVYRLRPDGTANILYAFTGGTDGALPRGRLLAGPGGVFYGTTVAGGAHYAGDVFRITRSGALSVLYSFTGGADGSSPASGVIADKNSNFYGTTAAGGAANNGTVFKLTPDGQERVLYSFTGGAAGGAPYGGLLLDGKGVLYGATSAGGIVNAACPSGCGVVFKLTP